MKKAGPLLRKRLPRQRSQLRVGRVAPATRVSAVVGERGAMVNDDAVIQRNRGNFQGFPFPFGMPAQESNTALPGFPLWNPMAMGNPQQWAAWQNFMNPVIAETQKSALSAASGVQASSPVRARSSSVSSGLSAGSAHSESSVRLQNSALLQPRQSGLAHTQSLAASGSPTGLSLNITRDEFSLEAQALAGQNRGPIIPVVPPVAPSVDVSSQDVPEDSSFLHAKAIMYHHGAGENKPAPAAPSMRVLTLFKAEPTTTPGQWLIQSDSLAATWAELDSDLCGGVRPAGFSSGAPESVNRGF